MKHPLSGAELLTSPGRGDDVTPQPTCGRRPNSSPRILVPALRDRVQVSNSGGAVSDDNPPPTPSLRLCFPPRCLVFFFACQSFFVTPNATLANIHHRQRACGARRSSSRLWTLENKTTSAGVNDVCPHCTSSPPPPAPPAPAAPQPNSPWCRSNSTARV